jgi:hypothetical protein
MLRDEDKNTLMRMMLDSLTHPSSSLAFVRNLEALRARYKIKRSFIRLVEQKRIWLYLS